jgi:hypothetical protein
LKLKKQQKAKGAAPANPDPTAEPEPAEQSKVDKLTEVANKILSATGNMDIYQETFESIQFKVALDWCTKMNFFSWYLYASFQITREEGKQKVPVMKEDDGSDMFGDDFDVKAEEKGPDNGIPASSSTSDSDKGKEKEKSIERKMQKYTVPILLQK